MKDEPSRTSGGDDLRRPARLWARPARSRRRGFSLLELTLAMLIMAVVLAMVAPTLRGFAASRQVKDTAAFIVALTKWARMQAISQGRTYRLYMDLDLREYWLEVQRGANFEELEVDYGQRFTVPEGVTIEWIESGTAERNGYLRFEPSGRISPSCRTRNRRTCMPGSVSPISSRKIVPLSADSNNPCLS